MSTSVISCDSMLLNSGLVSGQTDVDFAKCDCCGLTEECTLTYIETIRQRYGGKWICGLCAEAVKDEILRCQKLISPDEAIDRHFSFCNKFRASSSSPPQDPAARLIRALSQILRKSLESPKFTKSMPSSPTRLDMKGNVLTRSESCIPSLTMVEASMYCVLEEEEGCEM